MNNPGFTGDHSRNMRVTRNPQQLITGRLARSMITQSQFANANDRIEINNVVADTAGKGDWWHVIATRVTPGTKAFFPECPGLREKTSRIAGRIVGTQYADDARYPRTRKTAQGYRRDPTAESRFAATPGNVRMTIDEPRYQPSPTDISDQCMWGGNRLQVLTDRQNAPSADG
jgi:hypothetical protein